MEVAVCLERLSLLMQAEVQAFRQRLYDEQFSKHLMTMDQELEVLLAAKKRSMDALREHQQAH